MLSDVTNFLQQPLSSNMSAARWFLVVGLVVVSLWGWHQIFRELGDIEGTLA